MPHAALRVHDDMSCVHVTCNKVHVTCACTLLHGSRVSRIAHGTCTCTCTCTCTWTWTCATCACACACALYYTVHGYRASWIDATAVTRADKAVFIKYGVTHTCRASGFMRESSKAEAHVLREVLLRRLKTQCEKC